MRAVRNLGYAVSVVGFAALAVCGITTSVTDVDLTWGAINSVALVCIGLTLSKEERAS